MYNQKLINELLKDIDNMTEDDYLCSHKKQGKNPC